MVEEFADRILARTIFVGFVSGVRTAGSITLVQPRSVQTFGQSARIISTADASRAKHRANTGM